MDDFDKKISESLLKGTAGAAEQKDFIYERLMKEIYAKKGVYKMRRMSLFKKVTTATAVTAAAIIIFFAFTPAGKVLAESIAKYFAPEKKIENEIEGQNNDTTGGLFVNTENKMAYAIYIDKELYTQEKSGGKDIIKAKNMPQGYPVVQMEISQVLNKTPQQLHNELMNENKGKYATVRDDGAVTIPVEGLKITLIKGTGSRDVYEKIFIVDNKAGGSFVIHQKLFVEAEEGHGARFDNMLRTFEIFKSEELAK